MSWHDWKSARFRLNKDTKGPPTLKSSMLEGSGLSTSVICTGAMPSALKSLQGAHDSQCERNSRALAHPHGRKILPVYLAGAQVW